jgi:hypothetical protein
VSFASAAGAANGKIKFIVVSFAPDLCVPRPRRTASFATSVVRGNKDYWAEPHATSAWDGSTLLFASVWGQPFSEYDLYTVTGSWW